MLFRLSSVVVAAGLSLAPTVRAVPNKDDPCKDVADPDSCYEDRCLQAFTDSGYTRLDTANYDKYYNEDSVLQYASAGVYEGLEGIAEYVEFFSNNQFYYASTTTTDTVPPVVLSGSKNKCVVLVADEETQVLNGDGVPAAGVPPLTTGATLTYVAGQKVEFQVRGADDEEILITRVDLYLPQGFQAVSFAQADPLTIGPFFCEAILFTSCPDIWEANFPGVTSYPTNPLQNPCLGALAALPPFEPVNDPAIGAITGNSFGCLLLHGAFAANGNPFHCPHASPIVPIPDDNDQLKCQDTEFNTVLDFFEPNELNYMYAAILGFGLQSGVVPGIVVTTPSGEAV